MISLPHQEIANFAATRITDRALIRPILSIALGIAISRKIPVPSAEVVDDSVSAYYRNTLMAQVTSEAAVFNEKLPVSIDQAETTARAFWILRYYAAHPLKVIPLVSDESHFMGALNGAGHVVDPIAFKHCQENSSTVISLVNKIRDIIG